MSLVTKPVWVVTHHKDLPPVTWCDCPISALSEDPWIPKLLFETCVYFRHDKPCAFMNSW